MEESDYTELFLLLAFAFSGLFYAGFYIPFAWLFLDAFVTFGLLVLSVVYIKNPLVRNLTILLLFVALFAVFYWLN